MKRLIIASIALLALGIYPLASARPAAAVTGSDWQAGRIIDDSVFYNSSTMSVGAIQAFLNAKVPSCDTNGTQPSEFGGGTRAQYGTARGYPPPYVCLKDYYENPSTHENNLQGRGIPAGGISAAQIIYNAAQTYSINPQALIATLQKESAGPLVTDTWPFWSQYRTAMGYACPDTAPCDAQYYGLYNQMTSAAWQFRHYANHPNDFRHKPNQNNSVRYNPNADCGSSTVYIQNMATSSLYNYTPYQPNQSALNNLYGSGDGCGAYGNRNFWRIFNDWFGSTVGPEYAWTVEDIDFTGGDAILSLGQSETVTLRVRNTGRATWSNTDSPVRLATWGYDRQSRLYTPGSWISPTRVATLAESTVAPNQVGTFTFQINPSAVGKFVEGFNLVAEGRAWMQWPGFSPTIEVFNGYSWALDNVEYSTGGGILEPNTSQTITVHARNTGNTTWSKSGGPPIRLGRYAPGPSPVNYNWISPDRAAEMDQASVAPGQTATFHFDVRVPGNGNFYERLNLVAEGMTWFNDTGLTLYLRGGFYTWQPLWVSHSTGTANIPRGQTFTLTVKAKNTGEVPWRKNGTIPIRLAPVAPLGRSSPFAAQSWISPSRVGTMQETIVQPGQEGTFVFTAVSPGGPGPYLERFSLVAEGVAWFNDPGFGIYVNSQ